MAGFKSCSASMLPKGSVLVTSRAPIGNIAIAGRDLCTNQGFKSLVPGKGVDDLYLYYCMKYNSRKLQALGNGATFKEVSKRVVENFEIPLPPLPEQKRIAAILDKADAIRRKRQRAVQLADDFLRAVFLDMFGDPVTNPKGWPVSPVGDICDCIVPGRDKPKSFSGDIPWITTNELIHLGTTIKKESCAGLTNHEISEVRARVVPKNSVIMTCTGALGTVSIAGENMVINQQLHAFLPSDYLSSSYLTFSLAAQKWYMIKMASSTTIPYMNKLVCNSIPVMLPPKKRQEEFELLIGRVGSYKSKLSEFCADTAFRVIADKAFSRHM